MESWNAWVCSNLKETDDELIDSTSYVGITNEHFAGNESPRLCEGVPFALLHVATIGKGQRDRLGNALTRNRLA
jgi:hypothetical protein